MPAEAPAAPAAAPVAPAAPASPAPSTPATPPTQSTALAQAPSVPSTAPQSKPGRGADGRFQPVSKPANDLNDAYSQLDQIASGEQAEPAPDDNKAGDEVVDQPTGEQKPAPGQEPENPNADQKPVKAKTLRETLEALKVEFQKSQTRVRELEATSAQPKADPEKETLRTQLTEAQKRLQAMDEEIRFSNYERSTEYKEKWEAPFIDAYEAGRNKVASFKLQNEDGTERMGTPQDFDAFMRITDDNDAAERAAELFGNKASMIMWHRERVQQMNASRLKALDDYRKSGGEREQARSQAAKARQQQLAALWEQEAKAAVDNPKYAPWFKAPEGDTAGKEILERGFAFADEAFGKPRLDENGKPVQRSPEEAAKMHAVVRNKAAAFDYQIYRNQKLAKELKELKKKLGEFEKSVPANGSGGGRRGSAALSTWDAIDADLARRANR